MKLSIVVPVYKTHDCIYRLLASARFEPKFNIEFIFIEDSPVTDVDKLDMVCGLFGYPYKILKNTKNMGVTYSRNKGYSAASGGYVVFMDSDDEFTIGGLDKIVATINHTESDVYMFRVTDQGGLIVGKNYESEILLEGAASIAKAYGIGECLIAVKYRENKLPFISQLRGHELAGLTRFIGNIKCPTLLISNQIVRKYNQDNEFSISKTNSFKERLGLISRGHFLVSKYLFQSGEYLIAMKWLIKAILRKAQSKL